MKNNRFGLAAALFAGVLLTHGPAAHQVLAQEEQTPASTEKNEETAPFEFDLIPRSVSFNSHVSFDESGIANHANGQLNVNVRMKAKSAVRIHEISNLRIIHAEVNTGEKIDHHPHYRRNNQPIWTLWNNGMGDHQSRHRQQEIGDFPLAFTMPEQQPTTLVEAVGTFDVTMPLGDPVEAVLAPFSDYEGKRVTFKEFPNSYVMVKSRPGRELGWGTDSNVVRIEVSRNILPHVARISLVDETGERLATNSSSSYGVHENFAHRMYQIDMPPKGQVRLVIYPKIRTQTISFTIRNVPLTKTVVGQTGNEVIVELKPVGTQREASGLERLVPVVIDEP